MRAVIVRQTGGPETLVVETVPDPRPGPRDVVIKVAACGVCFHDVVTRNGTLKAGVALPFIPGHEVSGTVVEVGREVSEFRLGDRVATTQRSHICGHCRFCRSEREPLCAEARFMGDAGLNGGYADYVATAADTIARIPDGAATEAAAIAACAIGTMLHAARAVGRVQIGERVLVTGASGGLGIHGIQLAKHMGAFTIGHATSPEKAEAVRAAGADAVVMSARGRDFSAEVREITGGEGVDVALDTVGTAVFGPVRRSMARAGRWVLIGQLLGDFVPFNPAQLFLRGISLLSATSTTRGELSDVLSLIERQVITPRISDILPLADAHRAHAMMERGGLVGRLLLRPAA